MKNFTDEELDIIKRKSLLISERINELAKAYTWKAENIVRFFDKLGMTTEEKVKFLAKEFAGVQEFGEIHEERRLREAERKFERG